MSEPSSSRLRRFLSLAAATTFVMGGRLAWRRFLRRGLPAAYQEIKAPQLNRQVEILRDKWGVPHIFAGDEHDLFFAQGFVHAQDRLFQMDIIRRVGSGRVSEVVGPSGLLGDRLARYAGWGEAIRAQVEGADDRVRRTLSAYAAGVNAYIAGQPLPVEFSLLRYKPEPWGLQDTAAIGAVLAWGLSMNWETELLRAALLEKLGAEKAVDLTPLATTGYQTILPDTAIDGRLSQELMAAFRQATAYWPAMVAAGAKGVGSNNWVVSGEHTASGRPILANDPHLPPTYPALWYENHLQGGAYDVTGFTIPGVPGVVIGHNEHVAWGFTNACPDIQDVYVERFHPTDPTLYEIEGTWEAATIREEVIKVRGRAPVVEKVRYTRHGPIFSDFLPLGESPLALRWVAHDPHNHLRALLDMDLAHDWDSFLIALEPWGFPSQNVVYADVHGHIAYKMPGKVPLRQQGSGLIPVPGWGNDYEWQGWIPFDALPTLHNPESGMIVTANNRVHGDSYPYQLTGEWLPDYRASRIWQLLTRQDDQTVDFHTRIQFDTLSLQARRFLPLALAAIDGIAPRDTMLHFAQHVLRQWDGDMRVDLIAPSIYTGWLTNFAHAVVRQAVGLELAAELFKKSPTETYQADPFLEIALDLSLLWLENGSPQWVGAIEPLLLPALRKTVRQLQRDFGTNPEKWVWGSLHQIRHAHPLARVPGLGRTWKTAPVPVGGDGVTVNQAEISPHFPPQPVEVIASCRLVMDVGAWDNSLAVLPGGQSENPASKHYEDGLADWRAGRYHPALFSRPRIEAVTEQILRLAPAGTKSANGDD